MDHLQEAVARLCGKDATAGHDALRLLEEESAQSNAVCAYLDLFLSMLEDKNSFLRNRALALIAANARWDSACKIDATLERYLAHITDDKPITARQCIKALPAIARSKPQLCARITEALCCADTSRYADSMRPLIEKDIADALKQLAAV